MVLWEVISTFLYSLGELCSRAPPLVTYVESKKDAEGKNEINLKEGELEKANKYAEDLAKKTPK